MTVTLSRRIVMASPPTSAYPQQPSADRTYDLEEIQRVEQTVPPGLVEIAVGVNVEAIADVFLEHVSLPVRFRAHGALGVTRLHFIQIAQQHNPDRATARAEKPA